MSLGAIIVQALLSGILWLWPSAILKRDQLKVSTVLTYFAILATCHLGGLLFAAPATLMLALYMLWVRYVGHTTSGTKHTLFLATVILSSIYVTVQIVHLPIRFALKQPQYLIEANVAGIFLALSLFCVPMELLFVLQKRFERKLRLEAAALNGSAIELEDCDLMDAETQHYANAGRTNGMLGMSVKQVERIAEICPYCEASVVPDEDGRCTACHRPIA